MSEIAPWFGRKFEFTFPVDQFPNLCIRLRGTPARLEEMVHAGSREAFLVKPADKWSAQEHAGHLADLEPLWLARVEDFLKDGNTLTIADLSNRKTHEANHNTRDLSRIAAEFAHPGPGCWIAWRSYSRKPLVDPCYTRACSNPCDWWTICILWQSTTIIIWLGYGR